MTGGGLTKKQLKYNKRGKIVSRKASRTAKKNNRLVKGGYVTRKGVFGVFRKGGMNNTAMPFTGVFNPKYSKISTWIITLYMNYNNYMDNLIKTQLQEFNRNTTDDEFGILFFIENGETKNETITDIDHLLKKFNVINEDV